MVLVDSNVWSEVLRKRQADSPYANRLRELIEREEVVMIGPVRQEVLSGIRDRDHFKKLRRHLESFPSQPLSDAIHELAASFFNACRAKGIQGSHTDFLICACSVAWEVAILSKDRDYDRYVRDLPIKVLHV